MSKPESEADRRRSIDPEIAQLVEEQRSSGMSVAAFAKARGVAPWKLYQAGKARKRRRREQFVEVAVTSEQPEPSPLEIVVRDDLRVRVPRDFDELALRRLLKTLLPC